MENAADALKIAASTNPTSGIDSSKTYTVTLQYNSSTGRVNQINIVG